MVGVGERSQTSKHSVMESPEHMHSTSSQKQGSLGRRLSSCVPQPGSQEPLNEVPDRVEWVKWMVVSISDRSLLFIQQLFLIFMFT